jgi:hypothetical protein
LRRELLIAAGPRVEYKVRENFLNCKREWHKAIADNAEAIRLEPQFTPGQAVTDGERVTRAILDVEIIGIVCFLPRRVPCMGFWAIV